MEPIKNNNGRLLTFDYSKSFTGVTRSELNMFADLIKLDFQQLVSSNQDFVDLYEFYKAKIDEILYRSNVTYTLSIVKNRESSPTILAKVKWQYKLNGRLTKSKYTSVHICSVSKYFKDKESADLKNPTLIIDAENKIWEYLNRVSPLELMKITGELYTL
jgi:hypothetical protein